MNENLINFFNRPKNTVEFEDRRTNTWHEGWYVIENSTGYLTIARDVPFPAPEGIKVVHPSGTLERAEEALFELLARRAAKISDDIIKLQREFDEIDKRIKNYLPLDNKRM